MGCNGMRCYVEACQLILRRERVGMPCGRSDIELGSITPQWVYMYPIPASMAAWHAMWGPAAHSRSFKCSQIAWKAQRNPPNTILPEYFKHWKFFVVDS